MQGKYFTLIHFRKHSCMEENSNDDSVRKVKEDFPLLNVLQYTSTDIFNIVKGIIRNFPNDHNDIYMFGPNTTIDNLRRLVISEVKYDKNTRTCDLFNIKDIINVGILSGICIKDCLLIHPSCDILYANSNEDLRNWIYNITSALDIPIHRFYHPKEAVIDIDNMGIINYMSLIASSIRLTIIVSSKCSFCKLIFDHCDTLSKELQQYCDENDVFLEVNYLIYGNLGRGVCEPTFNMMNKYPSGNFIRKMELPWFPCITYEPGGMLNSDKCFVMNGKWNNKKLVFVSANWNITNVCSWMQSCNQKKLPSHVLTKNTKQYNLVITTGSSTIDISRDITLSVTGGSPIINILNGNPVVDINNGFPQINIKGGAPKINHLGGSPKISVSHNHPDTIISLHGGNAVVTYN